MVVEDATQICAELRLRVGGGNDRAMGYHLGADANGRIKEDQKFYLGD